MGELGTEVCLHAENLRAMGGKGGVGIGLAVLVEGLSDESCVLPRATDSEVPSRRQQHHGYQL
jgi:hypothetical protein